MRDRVEYALPDGSTCIVEDDGRMAGIERWVAGECVWGQVFSHSYPDVHASQIADVVASMRERPEAYNRRLLWDRDGRAVTC